MVVRDETVNQLTIEEGDDDADTDDYDDLNLSLLVTLMRTEY